MICDKCGSHRMQGHSICKRTVRDIEGTVDIMVRRLRCEDCGRTQAVPQGIAPNGFRMSFKFMQRIIEMADAGYPVHRIALRLGIAESTVYRIMKENRDG